MEETKKDLSQNMMMTSLREDLIPGIVGAATFFRTSALSTSFQKSIGVTTVNTIPAQMIGFATVCMASMASQRSTEFSREVFRGSMISWNDSMNHQRHSFHPSYSSNQFYNVGFARLPKEDVHAYVTWLSHVDLGLFRFLMQHLSSLFS